MCGHRRGDAQSRLQGAGHRHRRRRQRRAGLRELGITVAIGHRADNLGERRRSWSSRPRSRRTIPRSLAARARLLPVVRRAEMLAELMRLKWSIAVGGTHGKTTTTSMVAALLDAGGLDPTVINGGIINAYGTNARLGARRLDGGRGRRKRRQLPAPAGDHRRRHQHRSRASRPLRQLRRGARRLRALRRERAVLRLRRAVHRPSRGAGDDPARRRPAHHHLRLRRPGRRARRSTSGSTAAAPLRRRRSATAPRNESRTHRRACACRCSASTMSRTRWPRSPWRSEMGMRRRHDPPRARRLRAASSGASPRPARRTASPSSTITATIRSRSPPCCAPRAQARRRAG